MKYNHVKMKSENKKNLIKLLTTTGPKTRAHLSRETGLAPSAVTRLIRELMEDGVITIMRYEEKSEPGRKGEVLTLSEKPVAVVFDIGVAKTYLGLAYLNGKVSVLSEFKTYKDPNQFFKFVSEKIKSLKNIYGVNIISFSVPGITDCESKEIILAPNLEWYNVKLTEFFTNDFVILLDNEANLSVLAESRFSEDFRNITTGVFVVVREGVGTGVLTNDEVVRGQSFSAGEFGHMIVSIDSNEKCHCGNFGCWELYASIRWANKKYGKLDGNTQIDKFDNLIERAKSNDEKATKVLKLHAVNIGIGLTNIVNGLNPEIIVLGGSVTNAPDWYFEAIRQTVKERALEMATERLIIRPTVFTDQSSNLIGAGVYAVQEYLENLMTEV